jgi:hypothetical protein
MNKDTEATRLVAQNIIGTPAHEDTRFPFGEFPYDIRLNLEQLLVREDIVIIKATESAPGSESVQEHPRIFLIGPFKKLRAETAFPRRERDQAPVITFDTQGFGEPLSDLLPAAPKLPSDGNKRMFFHDIRLNFFN